MVEIHIHFLADTGQDELTKTLAQKVSCMYDCKQPQLMYEILKIQNDNEYA